MHLSYNLDKKSSFPLLPTLSLHSDRCARVAANRLADFSQLLDKSVFDVVPIENAESQLTHGARSVDQVSSDGTPQIFRKSRPAGREFEDKTCSFLTHAQLF